MYNDQYRMKVAITHDWLVSRGGAEKVLESLLEVFPGADVYTSVCDRNQLPPEFNGVKISTSFIQNLPFAVQKYRSYIGLMPAAFKSFDLRGYDVVISNSHACAKCIRVPSGAAHICYCLTPMRYIWDMYGDYMRYEKTGPLVRLLAPTAAAYLRRMDVSSAAGVDAFAAISGFVSQRIRKYYGRESAVIFPPVETGRFSLSQQTGDYFLVVSRLVPQKRTDAIIKAFNELKLPLKIVGTGRQEPELKKLAGPNVEFLGYVSEEEKAGLLSRCRALVFASLEDFGIVPVEAMASGRPVIAYGAGGVLDTVVPGETGILFSEQTPESIAGAVLKFEKMDIDPVHIKRSAERFGKELFKQEIKKFVLEAAAAPEKRSGR